MHPEGRVGKRGGEGGEDGFKLPELADNRGYQERRCFWLFFLVSLYSALGSKAVVLLTPAGSALTKHL